MKELIGKLFITATCQLTLYMDVTEIGFLGSINICIYDIFANFLMKKGEDGMKTQGRRTT